MDRAAIHYQKFVPSKNIGDGDGGTAALTSTTAEAHDAGDEDSAGDDSVIARVGAFRR